MTSPGAVQVGERTVALLAGESVLEALERAGLDVASGCRAGTCAKCMLRADDPPAASQRGLRPTLRASGHFLACQAYPTGTLKLASAEAPPIVRTTVASVEDLAPDVRRLCLEPQRPLDFHPGQYLDVLDPQGAARNYSIASLPADGVLELHVRRVPGGRVSPWLHGLEPGAPVRVRGAFGQCFHVADDPRRKLLLVGAGTGLAPLLGIARDALEHGHQGPVDLVHGALAPDRLYLRDGLSRLASRWPNLRVHYCVLRDATPLEHEGSLDQVAVRLAGDLADTRAFLCGDAGLVRTLQRSLFLAGVPSGEILADPFVATR